MRLAIIGTGISGLVAARLLHRRVDLTVYEANSRIGGHTNTVSVSDGPKTIPIDTGFIVYNERTYPQFLESVAHSECAVATFVNVV